MEVEGKKKGRKRGINNKKKLGKEKSYIRR